MNPMRRVGMTRTRYGAVCAPLTVASPKLSAISDKTLRLAVVAPILDETGAGRARAAISWKYGPSSVGGGLLAGVILAVAMPMVFRGASLVLCAVGALLLWLVTTWGVGKILDKRGGLPDSVRIVQSTQLGPDEWSDTDVIRCVDALTQLDRWYKRGGFTEEEWLEYVHRAIWAASENPDGRHDGIAANAEYLEALLAAEVSAQDSPEEPESSEPPVQSPAAAVNDGDSWYGDWQ